MKIATSILNADNRIESIKKLNNSSTDYIHIDTMDNIFVPNYHLPIDEVNMLEKITKKKFDIHLMMENPIPFIESLNYEYIDSITIHIEIKKDILEIIKLIKAHNIKVGLAIKPNTPNNILDKYINLVDKIIVMSVEPGFGGQSFIENTPNKIKDIRTKRKDIIIEVDGGINNKTIEKINTIADIAVVGSYITKNDTYEEAIKKLKNKSTYIN